MTESYERSRLIALFGDDPATLADIEREFLVTARVAGREIGQSDDMAAIARSAHRLKGASGMIGAVALGRIAEAVEHAAAAADLPGVRRLHDRLSREVDRIAAQAGNAG